MAGRNRNSSNGTMTPEQFVLQAINKLEPLNKVNPKTGQQYKGIHVVYSGFNEAFKLAFPDLPGGTTTDRDGNVKPIPASRVVTDRMAAQGLIAVVPSFGGATLYRPGDAPARAGNEARAKSTLATILGS